MGYKEWTIDTECPFYTDLEPLFLDKGKDESDSKTTHLGHQFEVTGSKLIDWKKIRLWMLEKIKPMEVVEIELMKAWCIDYQDGGYQTMHRHSVGGLGGVGVVISLDDQPEENKTGRLYTINNNAYTDYRPHKGRAVIITGGIWHGVYPSKNPRRTFVADYKINKIKGITHGIRARG